MFFSSFQNCGNTWKKDTGLEGLSALSHILFFFFTGWRFCSLVGAFFLKCFFYYFFFSLNSDVITLKIGSMCSGIFRPKKIVPEYESKKLLRNIPEYIIPVGWLFQFINGTRKFEILSRIFLEDYEFWLEFYVNTDAL